MTPQQSLKERHVARSQSLVENIARQTVDLHDQKAAATATRRRAEPKPADPAIETPLQEEKEIVRRHL